MARLLLVEDHVLVRQSIRALLESAGFTVIGEASTGTEAVRLARDLCPDVIVMDIHLPEMNGIEAARQIRRQDSSVHIVALTAYNEKAYERALNKAGADAYILKTAAFSELLNVIQRVTMTNAVDTSSAPDPVSEPASLLTARESEVLVCAGRGWTNKQIGAYLGISDRTVQVHLQTIYYKLGVTNRTEAVLRGLALNLIQPTDGTLESE